MREALIELFPFKDGMNWMAVDEDGSVYQYSKQPWPNTNGEWDIDDYSTHYDKLGLVSPPQDWTTTLVKREEWKLSDDQLMEIAQAACAHVYDGGVFSTDGVLEIINMYESFKSKV